MKRFNYTYLMVIIFVSIIMPSTALGYWDWMNPEPQGNSLYEVWAAPDGEVFRVGDHGTIGCIISMPATSYGPGDLCSCDVMVCNATYDSLPEFVWPSGAGSASGIYIYAGMTNPAMTELIGEFDMFTFSWHP